MTPSAECHICGDDETDLETCLKCGRRVCMGCCEWCCDPEDEDDGDWFCNECIEEAQP